MAYLGRRGALAPLTSADIPVGIVEGTDVAFLENASGTQNLTGTYSTERMYLNDSYTLTGDVTVTGHLALGSIADEDIVITQDGTERTITGSGTLESGDLLHRPDTSDLTGMTGELGSAVTGTLGSGVTGGSGLTALGTVTEGNLSNSAIVYPSGHILQVETSSYSTETSTSSTSFVPTGHRITIDPIKSNSKIIVSYDTGSTHWNASNGNSKGSISIHNVTGTPSQVLGSQICTFVQTSVTNHYGYINMHGTAFEVLSTDSAQTYEIYIRAQSSGNFYYRNANGSSPDYARVNITAMEIGQ